MGLMNKAGEGAQSTSIDSSTIKSATSRGALWLSITSIIAAPLAFYRNWVLGQLGTDGGVVGNFALILLLVEVTTTFVMFGGGTAVIYYVSRLPTKNEKASFLFSYLILSVPTALMFLVAIRSWPQILSLLTNQSTDMSVINMLVWFVPLVILSQLTIYGMSGIMHFRALSLLLQLQLFVVSAFGTVAYLFFPNIILGDSLLVLGEVVGAAFLVVILVGGVSIVRELGFSRLEFELPSGFWRYAAYVQGNTLCTFAELSIDKIFVLSSLGVRELGAYFVLSQCAELIRLVPVRLGQVLLAAFSKLIVEGRGQELERSYSSMSRLMAVISSCCAFTMIIFSQPIAAIFGSWVSQMHEILIILSVLFSVSSVSSINGMLILAKERTGAFLAVNTLMISVQFVLTMLLIGKYSVFGVVAGRLIGGVVGQVGLFLIVRSLLDGVKLGPPNVYWINQLLVVSAAVFVLVFQERPLYVSLTVLLAAILFSLYTIRDELRKLVVGGGFRNAQIP